MKIVYFGNNRRGVKCLEVLDQNGFDVIAVVVHHRSSNEAKSTSVHQTARDLSLPVYDPTDVNSQNFLAKLKAFNPDLMILSGYNQILKKEILQIPSRGTINLHGGYLPFYRGGSPINWQIINGETVGGCAILFVDEGIDTGDIIVQETYLISANDTAGEIAERTLDIFPRLLVDVVRQIEAGPTPVVKQDVSSGTYYCKRYPQDGRIFWDKMTDQQIHNMVRALNGVELPGAFTYLDGRKIIIWRTRILNRSIKGVSGRIALRCNAGVIVIAANNGLLITEIKNEDEQEVLSAKDHLKICGLTFS